MDRLISIRIFFKNKINNGTIKSILVKTSKITRKDFIKWEYFPDAS